MYIDDSAGRIGHDLHEMMALHARACAAARPEPRRLAAWLARLRLEGPGWPDFELRDFAAALGEKGRAELARIVDERARNAEADLLGKQPFEIRILREQLAELSGNIDDFVAILAEDLNTRQYLKIVTALRGGGLPTHPAIVPARTVLDLFLRRGGDMPSVGITSMRPTRSWR